MCYLTTLISPFVMHSRYSTMSRSNNREIPAPGPGTRKDSIRRRSTKDPKRYNSWTALFVAVSRAANEPRLVELNEIQILDLLAAIFAPVFNSTHLWTYASPNYLQTCNVPLSNLENFFQSKVDVFRRLSKSSTSKRYHQTCRMQRPESSINDIESTIT